jgi:transcriptional antiterminator RfaH
MLRLADNPPITCSPSGIELLSDEDWALPWYIAYCRPRQEKAFARDLMERGICYFLPMVVRETSSGGRRRRNYYPLFCSYAFFAGDESVKLASFRTNRLVRVDEPRPAEQQQLREELKSLAIAISVAPEKIELYRHLHPGNRVIIKSGPMKGVEGTVVTIDNTRKLQISVSLLGVGAVVEIHPDLVEVA